MPVEMRIEARTELIEAVERGLTFRIRADGDIVHRRGCPRTHRRRGGAHRQTQRRENHQKRPFDITQSAACRPISPVPSNSSN
jgi:hypothetical protein